MAEASSEAELLKQVQAGNPASLGQLLDQHRARLRKLVLLRVDPMLRGRIYASDVIQETQLEAAKRLEEYLRDPAVPFFVWLRFLCTQRLAMLRRFHLVAQARTAARDRSIFAHGGARASSAALAARLLGRLTHPSAAAIRTELKRRLRAALAALEPLDREILTLRHLEQLSAAEAAAALGIKEEAAKKRHLRALQRLKKSLAGEEDQW